MDLNTSANPSISPALKDLSLTSNQRTKQDWLELPFILYNEYGDRTLIQGRCFHSDDILQCLLKSDSYIEVQYGKCQRTYPITSAGLYQAVYRLDSLQRQYAYGFDPLLFEKEKFSQYFNLVNNATLKCGFSSYIQGRDNETGLRILQIASYTRNLFALKALFMMNAGSPGKASLFQVNLLDYMFPTIADIDSSYQNGFYQEMLWQSILYTPHFLKFVLYDRGTSLFTLQQSDLYKILYENTLSTPTGYERTLPKLRAITDLFIASKERRLLTSNQNTKVQQQRVFDDQENTPGLSQTPSNYFSRDNLI